MDPNELRKLAALLDPTDYLDFRCAEALNQAADEIELLTKKGQGLCIQNGQILIEIHDVKQQLNKTRNEIEKLRTALERAIDEGTHSTKCNIRKDFCTCWVEEALNALDAPIEGKKDT